MSVKIPFITSGALSKSDSGFIDMLRNRICPNFEAVSFSSALLLACLAIFVATRIMYTPGGYTQFLQQPQQMNKFALDIELIKSNRVYYYETVTSMFLHDSYRSMVSNLIFGFFILYELQCCWRLGVLVALVAGFAANSMAIATSEGILMGLSGVLCAGMGIMFAALILHCSYLRASTGSAFYIIFFTMGLMLVMIIMMGTTALLYFFALIFGLLFGLALYPRGPEAQMNENVDKLLKVFSVGFLGLAVLLGLIV